MKQKAVTVALVVLFTLIALWLPARDQWRDRYVKIGDIKIHYIEAGAGDSTIVFVPGWTMTAEVWREQIPYFSARGFRVIAYDPRGHGLTTKTESGNTYRQHAADFHAFLKQLKIEHCHMVGWASGATMLLEYFAASEKLKPEKIVLVESAPAALKTDVYPGTTTLEQARRLLLSLEEDRDKATDAYVRSLFKGRPAEWLITEMKKGSLKTDRSAAYALYFDLLTGDRTSALMRLPVPTLLITTAENQAVAEFSKSKITRGSVQVIEDSGPAMFLEKPQAFNQALEAFLGEH